MEEPRSEASASAAAGAAVAGSRVSSGDLPFIDAVEEQDCGRRSRPPSRADAGSRRTSHEDERPGSRRPSRDHERSGSRRPSRSPAPPRRPSHEDERPGSRRTSHEDERPGSRRTSRDNERPGSRRPSRSPAPPRRSSRVTDGEDERPGSRRPSRSPASALDGESSAGGEASDAGARPASRRGSTAPGSRQASRRSSRAFLDVDYNGRRRSSSRRGSHVDLAEVVMSELRRPTRRSSRAIALELGEIVSVEVRRESRSGSRGSTVEEVRAQVRRQSLSARGARPSLLTQRGSRGGATSDDDDFDYGDEEDYPKDVFDDDDDEQTETDDASASLRSGPGQLEQGSRIPQYVAAVVVNLASFCNGVVFGWPSVALPLLQSRMSPIEGSPLDDEESSWLASTIAISACLSTPFWLMINDRYGRKNTGYLVALAFALHWIVLGVTRNTVCLYTARAIGGLGTGGCFAVCPTYAKEISEDAIRGTLGIVFTIMFNLGILVAYSVGAAVSYKGVNILGMSFVLLFIISFWQLPETPVHLLAKGKNYRAARSLQWLRGKGADVMDELSMLRKANKRRRQEGDATLFEVLSDRASFKGMIITSVLCANQPMCGIAVVLSYTVNIFMEAGVSISPYMATIIVGVLLLISSYAASYMVDRAGRKIMLLISNVGLAVCLGALGLYFFIKHLGINTDTLHLGWLPIASLSLFVVFVSLGVAPLPFVIITEIFLPQAQRIASIMGYVIIWGLTFICMKFFTNIANAVGLFSCYWIFAAYCVLMCAFVQIYVPETKGRSLDSILDELSGEIKPLLLIEEKVRNNYGV